MGIIIKQSIKGTIWSYIGVVIGFVTTAYLYSNYLSPELVGLFGLLLSYSLLFAQFSSLGIKGITSRLFPFFRDKENGHNGYMFIVFSVILVGFLLFLMLFYLFSGLLIESNLEKSKLFADNVFLLIPMTFFALLFGVLDNYNRLLYNAVLGTFLQEFFQRVLIFLIVVAFAFGWYNSQTLIVLFTIVVSAKGVYIFLYLLFKGELKIKPRLNFITKNLRKEMIDVAVFNILAGAGVSIVFSLDKIIVNQYLGLSSAGVYTMAFSFGALVIIPSRSLLRISGTLIAEAWKRDDKKYILDIYSRSSLNQFIVAMFLFGGIWINIDNIQVILGPDYEGIKWVIFFIGLANIIDMVTGANSQVIGFSKYYRVVLYFIVVLIALVVVAMLILIPMWGITGAAIAIAISMFINNLMRYLYILFKFKMQPFSLKFLYVPAAFGFAWFLSSLLNQQHLVVDIFIRSVIFTVVFGGLILGMRVSDDVNKLVLKTIDIVRKKFYS